MKLVIHSLALLAASLVAATAQTTLVNQDFSSGSRTAQNPPSSLHWYSTSVASSLSVSNGQMVVNSTTASRGAVAYFTPVGDPYTLAVGEAIKLTFDFTPTTFISGANAGNIFCVGLFDSLGNSANRYSADAQSFSPASGPNSDGYAVRLSLTNTGNNLTPNIAKRSGDGGALITNSNAYTTLGTGTAQSLLTQGTTYQVAFSILRDDISSSTISFSLSGGDLTTPIIYSVTDSNGYFSFDTIAISLFQTNSGLTPGIGVAAYNNITLQVIPESGSIVLAGTGLAFLAGVARIRKRLTV